MKVHWLITNQDSSSFSYRINSIMLQQSIHHSLNFSVLKKSVPNVDKLTLSVYTKCNGLGQC
jgi:hypothetical protein